MIDAKNLQRGQSVSMETHDVRKTIGNFSAFVICINYVVGTGIFSLPFGFYKSGILLSTICLLVSGVFSLLCAYWVLEVLARTEGITSSVYDIQSSASFNDDKAPVHQVTFRKFDFTKMFETYYGVYGKYICQLIMGLYCYGVLWAFTAVFSVSVSSLFYQFVLHKTCDISLGDQTVDCRIAYYICVLLFSIIVIPLACVDVGEQAVVQVTLATYRAIAFLIMVVTVAIALFHPNPYKLPTDHVPKGPPYLAFDSWFKLDGFSTIFSSSVVALTFHYCIPDLIVTVKDKKSFQKVITAAIITIIVVYFVFGVVIAIYFGDSTNALVTLNWLDYTGQDGGWGKVDHRPWWAAMIQLLVMIFPILDMLSVFPLVAITLGNNIQESMPRIFKDRFKGKPGKIICRLLACLPPIAMGAGLGELNKIFTFTALFAFFLEFVFPSFLQISSVRMCEKWWGKGSEITPYSTFISKFPFVIITLVFASLAFLFDFVAFVKPSYINKMFAS